MTGPNEPLPLWNVPYQRNPYFTGREDVLNQLYRTLHTENIVALSHPQGISGLGGIGKTQIALEYAYRYRTEYQTVLWVRADSVAALISSFVELAYVLELPEHYEQDQEIIVQAVLHWLRLHTKWLLIYDNIDDISTIEPFFPKAGSGHIIFTTRAHTFGTIAQRLEMEMMEPDTGALLLLRRASILPLQAPLDQVSEDDLHFARLIAQELDGLPIALDQAGAYIKEMPCTLSDYLLLYQLRRRDLLQTRGTVDMDYPASVATTWSLSLEKIAQANPASAELLTFYAFLAPDAIPEEILTVCSPLLGESLASIAADPIQLDLATREPLRFSLIARDTDTQCITMHRLVQAVLQDTLPAKTRTLWKHRAVNAINAAFPDATFENWPRCEQLSSHAQVCAYWIEQEGITGPEAARLLYETGSYLYARARYREAESLLKQALAIREQQAQSGSVDPDTALLLNSLASLYQAQGRYAEAEPLFGRALSICEQRLGPEHPNTAHSLNNLSSLYQAQGRYAEAEPLLRRAISICEQGLGPEHPITALSLNNLSSLYRAQGRYTEAELLLQRAVSIREQQLGANHPDTATSINDLAGLYRSQSKYEQAEPLYLQALAIREQQLGANHPDTATSLNDLAWLYEKQGKQTEAESLYLQALAILEQQLGADHPSTLQNLSNLAKLYQKQGKNIEAESLLRKVQATHNQQLSQKDSSLAPRSSNLAPPVSDMLPPSSTEQRPLARFGAPFPEIWNVPRRHNPFFTGRDHLLEQLFDGFRPENTGAIVSPQALIGLDGIGKTQAAAEYAYRYRAEYQAVLWVRAETREDLIADFKTIAGLLNLPQDYLQDQARLLQTMQEWFQIHSDWLLIFDNADDPELVASFLPRAGRGHVLLTTRATYLQALAKLFVLDPLKPEEGALCILRRAGYLHPYGQLCDASPASADAARELSQLMDGLPVALEQAGAYIEETGRSVSGYLALYQHYRSKILQYHDGAVPNYFNSVVSAWSIAKSLIEQTNPAAVELLRLCAFLPPGLLLDEIFTSGAANLGPILSPLADNPIALDSTIRLLVRHSLIQREVDRETDTLKLSMHRILQEIIQDDMDQPTKRLWAERAAYILPVDVTKVQVEVRTGSVMILGMEGELVLRVTNSTIRPMGKVDIELTRSAEYDHLTSQSISIPSLPPHDPIDVCFQLRMKVARRVSINYLVNGIMMDPPFSVYVSRDNPYIYGNPIDEGEFFGRQEELETIVQAVTKPIKQDILVVGERRTGKTSLLYQLAKRLDVPFIVIYIVLNTCRTRTDDVLEHVLHKIVQCLVERGVLEQAWGTHKFLSNDFTERVDEVLQEAGRTVENLRLILLLDEADFLLQVEEEPVFSTLIRSMWRSRHRVDERVQRVLRAALQSQKTGSRLRAVVAGTTDLSTYMLQHSSPFFNHFRFLHLKPLSLQEACDLIVTPAKMLGMTFSPNAIERIISLSGCQPYYCQALCYEAFAHAQKLNSRLIDDAEVTVAEQKICRDFFHAFRSGIWHRSTRRERAVLAALVKGEPRLTTISNDLQRLLDWQIVVRDQERYCFAAGLFEQWTAKALKEG